MMQRKNKRSSAAVHGVGSNTSSGYESSSSNAGANNDSFHHGTTSSLQPPPPPAVAAVAAAMMIPSSAPSPSTVDDVHLGNRDNNKSNTNHTTSEKVKIATVKRYTCGTRPFDYYWLNLDCCGLICASLTYMLHIYAIYSFGWILLPPWFSIMDEDGYRYLTLGCYFHRLLFIGIAFLAIFSHFKAMTTDPGAVPPDAYPLSEKEGGKQKGDWEYEELDTLIKGEVPLHHYHHHPTHQSLSQQHQMVSLQQQQQQQQQQAAISLTNGDENSKRGTERTSISSSLMQDDPDVLDDYKKRNNIGLPQAATATATAAVVAAAAMTTGGLATVGVMALAGAGTGAGVGLDVVGARTGRASNNGIAAVGLIGGEGAREEQPFSHENENLIHSPSSLQQQQQQQQRGRRMCRRCHAFKPPRAHHCSICKRCIIKMDHHCPWVNNCVGIGNHKYFLLFIFYTSISCAYSFLLLIYRFCHCVGKVSTHHHYHGPRCVDHPNDLLPLVGLTVEALLFGLFTICMMADQWDVVMTNLTHIDRLKNNHHYHGQQHQHADAYGKLPAYYHQHVGNPMSIMRAGINEVFGTVQQAAVSSSTSSIFPRSKFHYTWLSPLHKVCFPENVRDDIFGYCRPCSNASKSQRMEIVGRGENMGWRGNAEIV